MERLFKSFEKMKILYIKYAELLIIDVAKKVSRFWVLE